MWKIVALGGLLALLVVSANPSRSAGTPAPTESSAPAEVPAPIVPNPGNESPPRDPLTPYDTGGAAAEWPYEALNTKERAVADRGRDTQGWEATHAVWEHANEQARQTSRALLAGAQLGVEDLGTIGVLP